MTLAAPFRLVQRAMAHVTRPAPIYVWVALGFVALVVVGVVSHPGRRGPEIAANRIGPPEQRPAPQSLRSPAPVTAPAPADPSAPEPSPPPVIVLPAETIHFWASYQDADPQTYVIDKVRLTFKSIESDDDNAFSGLTVRVETPGVRTRTFRFTDVAARAQFGVGQLDLERLGPQILLVPNSGGTHCCNLLKLATPRHGRWRLNDLGAWDGDGVDAWPIDRDHDGAPEFRSYDNAFLYVFTPYVSSAAPPQFTQVQNGALVDVSKRKAFRRFFEEAMTEDLEACRVDHANGACAAFVADAARLGRKDWAWKIMLQSYDPKDDWGFGHACFDRAKGPACLVVEGDHYANFPEALDGFLTERGYFAK
jgi:hypothetical protein